MSKVTKLRAIAAPKAKGPTKNYFRTVIDAQSASAGPPLGPLLGKFGINIGSFCKDFNELTKRYKPGIPLPVTVNIKPDRTYTIGIHTPNMEYYLMQAAGIRRAKCEGDTTASGKITIKHVYEIAKIKHEDPFGKYQLYDIKEVVNKLLTLAEKLGIEVVKDLDPIEYEEFLKKREQYLEELDKRIEEERKARLQRS